MYIQLSLKKGPWTQIQATFINGSNQSINASLFNMLQFEVAKKS